MHDEMQVGVSLPDIEGVRKGGLTSAFLRAGYGSGKSVVLSSAFGWLVLLVSLSWVVLVCSHLGEVACSGRRFRSEGGGWLSWVLLV